MPNPALPHPIVRHSFLVWWVLANIVALPVLFGPYHIGYFLFSVLFAYSDGFPVGSIWYLFIYIILALCCAILGGWLGFMQSLALRMRFPADGMWILASSVGVGLGAPLGWIVYRIIFQSPIVNRPDGIYFSDWYEYIAFGAVLGLSVGVAQWLVLRQSFSRTGWWIVILPPCFTLEMALTNFYLVSDAYIKPLHWLTQRIALQFPYLWLSNIDLLIFIAILSALAAMVGVSVITGGLLNWLLDLPKKQVAGRETGS